MAKPMPDVAKLPEFHYLPLNNTPGTKEDGTPRNVDDFAPIPNLKRLFAANELSADDDVGVRNFAEKFITQKEYVVTHLKHVNLVQILPAFRPSTYQIKYRETISPGY